jgi:hypothetical protein
MFGTDDDAKGEAFKELLELKSHGGGLEAFQSKALSSMVPYLFWKGHEKLFPTLA